MNLAHLDIRPENICISLSNSGVVLIDLDRYEMSSKLATMQLQGKYGAVDMYSVLGARCKLNLNNWIRNKSVYYIESCSPFCGSHVCEDTG